MRILRRLLLLALVLVLLLGFAGALLLDRGAALAVEKGATRALAVPTEVSSVTIHPFRGSIGLADLSVANPAGFSEQPCLALDAGSMQVDMSSLMKDTVLVPSLELSGVRLRLEGRGTQTNYGALLENLKRHDSGEPGKSQPETTDAGSQKRFLVRELVIRDVIVEADYALDSPLGQLASSRTQVTLPEIRLHDIGNGKSLSLAQLSAEIFRALIAAAASGQLPGISGDIASDLRRSLEQFKSGADGSGGLKQLGRDLESGVKDAAKGLEDLFKKKD